MTNIYYDVSYFDQNSTWYQEDLNWRLNRPGFTKDSIT